MKKRFFYVLIILLVATLYGQTKPAATSTPSPYEPSILKSFADSLYEEGFLTQAEGEYKRYLFSQTDFLQENTDIQTSLLALYNIYKKQNDTN